MEPVARSVLASIVMADWPTFLQTVDAEETDKDVLRDAEELFLAAKFRNPQSAAGISVAKLEQLPSFPKELPTQAFISRTIETLSAVKRNVLLKSSERLLHPRLCRRWAQRSALPPCWRLPGQST